MGAALEGQLGKQFVADLIREVARKKLTGRLRLSQKEVVKTVFFESGVPVYAASELASEQLEYKLLKDRHTTIGLVEAAKQRNPDADRLGRTLIDIGVLPERVIRQVIEELAAQVMLSLFEWESGQYSFEEGVKTSLGGALKLTPTECILHGSRQAACNESYRNAATPRESLIFPALSCDNPIGRAANLNSVEAYVLSCISSPARVSEVSALTGFSEEDARRAICVLLALGLLTTDEGEPQPAAESGERAQPQDEVTVERAAAARLAPGPSQKVGEPPVDMVIEAISRKLILFETANYYEILGVTRIATTAAIRQAYSGIREMIESYRTSWPDHKELNGKLEALSAAVENAYATLSALDKRMAYDQPKNRPASQDPVIERGRPEPAVSKAAEAPPQMAEAVIAQLREPPVTDPAQEAERRYRRGRAHYERRDMHTAVHLFREAVKLDQGRSEYHYYLGLTLSILSQARHAHAHAEGCHVTCTLGGSLISNQRIRHEAEQHLLRAAEMEPSNAEVRVRLGLLYKEAAMMKKAEHYFWSALMLDGNNQTAMSELEELEQQKAAREQPSITPDKTPRR